jgi:hypothetical protein
MVCLPLFLSMSFLALQQLVIGNRLHVCCTHRDQNQEECRPYEPPAAKKLGRGHPPKKGKAVRLAEWFKTHAADFQTAKVTLYGKDETVSFLCVDLLWVKGSTRNCALYSCDRASVFKFT